MFKKKCLLTVMWFAVFSTNVIAQNAPPSSGNALSAARSESVAVNNYTGIPNISLPIYSYAHPSGIGLNISLDYFAGGIKVNEAPSSAGLGWNLSLGGVITRTVRSLPDDCPAKGYLFTPAIQSDERSKTLGYENGCIDGEQDIFQFSFAGRSGKFYIGKDSLCYATPLSKMKIKLTQIIPGDEVVIPNPLPFNYFTGLRGRIQKFTILTEDGTTYVFDEIEEQRTVIVNCNFNFIVNCNKLQYATAWYLTKIISYTGKDSIKINYTTRPNAPGDNTFQSATINSAGTVTHTDTLDSYQAGTTCTTGKFFILNKIPSQVILPNKTKVELLYSGLGQFGYGTVPILQRIKIMDSVFRYGYMLNWDTTNLPTNSKFFLMGLNYYTNDALKIGYQFSYNSPYLKWGFDEQNKKDHWGFYNGANNHKDYVPTVAGLYTGADRNPNMLAQASTLSAIKDANGSITYYDFENNDSYPYNNTKQSLDVDLATNTQNSISVSKVFGKKTYFKLRLKSARAGSIPITGTGNLNISITNLSGTTTYSTSTINLIELYYNGYATFDCEVPNGSYLLKTNLAAGTSSSTGVLSNISWFNQTTSTAQGEIAAGIRIKQIRHFDPFTNKTDTLSTYKYVREDGKSSGFLSLKPIYDFDYYDGTNSLVHKINSNIINDNDYAAANNRGYSRVEVIKGTAAQNLGKQVFEYTNIDDQDFDNSPMEYPYMPRKQAELALGLPKRTLVYDNTGRLIQKTTNVFNYTALNLAGDINNYSIKVGRFSDYADLEGYNTQKYHPELGRVDLTATTDTFYHPDNSITTSKKAMFYDTNYNVTKIVTPYDLNKNLSVEKRIYYPYNYTVAGSIGYLRDSGIFVPVSTESWIVGDGFPRMVAASVNDYQYRVLIIKTTKPLRTYSLQTNKPIPQNTIGVFNPAVLIRDTNLIKMQQTNFIDNNDQLLFSTNAQSKVSNTVIYGYHNNIIAKISNAKNTDVAFTSFEPGNEGLWTLPSDGYDSTNAITGKYSLNLSQRQITKSQLNADITYVVSYWTKGSVYLYGINNNNTILEQRNGWNFYMQKFTGVTDLYITGSGLIDELRLYPSDANMETTCYGPLGKVLSTCDANNNINYYEYDLINRVKLIRDKDKNIVKKYDYSDGYTLINTTPNWQVLDSTQYWECEHDSVTGNNNGKVDRAEKDINPNSETYGLKRFIFDHIDFGRCPYATVPCGITPQYRQVGPVCEIGQKIYTAGVYRKVNLPEGGTGMRWVCTFHYLWTDGVISQDYSEISGAGVTCPITYIPAN